MLMMPMLWRHFFYHIGHISRGVFHMFLLRTSWCDDIGNSRAAFLFALILNMLAVPLGAWFSFFDPKNADLTLQARLIIEAIVLMVTLISIFLMALCRGRMHKFPIVYAGVTYSGMMIALILAAVQGLGLLYDQSLYGQTAPNLAHGPAHLLLVGAVVWMIVLTSFVFKTALKIGVAASVMMTAILFFILTSGRYILGILWLHYF